MSTNFNVNGGVRSDSIAQPSTTAKTAIYTQTERGQATALSLRATQSSGGAVTLQLHFYDASETRESEIYPVNSLSDKSTTLIDMGGLTLDRDDELRATVDTVNALDLVFTYALLRGGQ